MKKILSLLSLAVLTIGLLGSCSKMNERIDGLDQRVGNIENEKIASIENQIAAINASIADLEAVKKDITDLKEEEKTLGKRIDTLKTYVETELPKYATEDWANATFATLDQLTATKADLLALQEKVDGPAISGAISNLDTRISALEARVSALEQMIQSVSITPAYSDGSVEAVDGILTLKCIVRPAEALAGMQSLKDSLLIFADSVKVKTKAATSAYMEIKVSEASVLDAAQGAITLKANISKCLPKGEDKALTVAVNIKNGISDYTTEFVPVTVAGPDIPEGALPGVFSVSASKQVHFSQGNLVATIDASGAPTAWKFATNQYDYIGEGGANKTIGATAGDVDLFGWSTAATKYGISTSGDNYDYSGDFVDWGKEIGDGSTWRTLSKDEWVYLFKTRSNASSLYKTGVSVCGKANCVIIAPDGYTGAIAGSYDSSTWPAAEADGLICLPAAGYRYGSYVRIVGDYGDYWSSSAYDSYNAYHVGFISSGVYPSYYDYRYYGCSVRLITDVEGSSPVEPEPVKEDPLSGKFSVSASKQVQFSKGNLYADGDKALHFEANQYSSASSWDASHVSHFTWSSTVEAAVGNTNSGDYLFCDESHKVSVDGGEAIYYALSKDEWKYLINKDGDENIRKGKYKYGVTVCGKANCLILAPDDFTGTIEASYDATAWASAEAAGLVCLPAAGSRFGSDVDCVGYDGYYWSSTAYDSNRAYYVYFLSNLVYPDSLIFRNRGFSVRLITDVK